jgi:transposase-like protein
MANTTRRQYSPEFKAKIVQEVLQGEKTIAQLAAEHGIHPNIITKWRSAALQAMPHAFDEPTQKILAAVKAEHEKEKEALYAEIGRLSTKLSWLEKKAKAVGLPLDPPGHGGVGHA